jgi:hypothetical protein
MEVAERKGTLERLSAFSDNVFSIIITIMVLELNPPDHPTFAALLPLWPTVVSYVVSYLFVANRLAKPPPRASVCGGSQPETDSEKFRASVLSVVGTVFDRLDGP